MIHLSAVTLTLPGEAGPVNILRGVDLAVTAGESVAIVGPSGSGKTSLLMILGGIERPTSGDVVIDGTSLVPMSEDALARFRRDTIGIVFQGFHLIPTMTALENVAIPLEFAGRGDAFERAAALLDDVGLAERRLHYPGQLSGGEQQRVALARAFAAGPKLLLADEPTGNLDRVTGQLIMDLAFRLQASAGTTLVLVTHDPGLAARCSRVLEFADGRIVAERRPEAAA